MSKKGITIIELIIVIIILILLAIIAIYNTQKMSLKADAILYETEFKALYTSLTHLQTEYNVGLIDFDERVDGKPKYYNAAYEDDDGVTWYLVYGKDRWDYSETVFDNLDIDELKYSYRFRLKDKNDDTKDEIYIEYYGRTVQIGDYTVQSYDDMINLMNSGAI
jgi:hypothetical protein